MRNPTVRLQNACEVGGFGKQLKDLDHARFDTEKQISCRAVRPRTKALTRRQFGSESAASCRRTETGAGWRWCKL